MSKFAACLSMMRGCLVFAFIGLCGACLEWWDPKNPESDGSCGNGWVDPDEICDDGNLAGGDLCSVDCSQVTDIADICPAPLHTCVAFVDGQMRCWGAGVVGILGSGDEENLGDIAAEIPAPDVDVGGEVAQISCNSFNTCALLSTGDVRCWGAAVWGQLGTGEREALGDDPGELPIQNIAVGEKAVQITVGDGHVCALLTGGSLRCWGWNVFGQLGYGHTDNLGDGPDEMPTANIAISGVSQVAAGVGHTCVLLEDQTVRCWGDNSSGQLGYEDALPRGDKPGDMPPPPVDIGPVDQIAVGGHHTCALRRGDTLYCWGDNTSGQAGQQHDIPDPELPQYDLTKIGDEPGEMSSSNIFSTGEDPAMQDGTIAVVVQVVTGFAHTCILGETGWVRCWGDGGDGQLGYGSAQSIGADFGDMPPPPVDVGGNVVQLAASGGNSTCALLADRTLRCWGDNDRGQLGFGVAEWMPTTTPAMSGPVPF